ncbi:MAG TPA: aldolase/citrate lyase family protein [Ktedonobacteraceae bacterium]|jgi:2-dehydro-3-deoxyglucarate aldolase/4-hydroxy-2-oxoheptanedioate aldolase
MNTGFKEKLLQQQPVIGTLVTLNAPEIAEILSHCGFDWLFIDMEHGALSFPDIQHLIQAVGERCATLVRIPENKAMWIEKVLDIGCDGIIVPSVNTALEAKQAIAAAKYPPVGTRSVGIARAHGYGMAFDEYVTMANGHVSVLIQIEHIKGVENLEEILNVDGIDGVLIGPNDLAGSMNLLGQVNHELVQEAISTIKQICRKRAVPVGLFTRKAEAASREIADGCQIIAVGTDTLLLSNAAMQILATVKNVG